MNFWCADASALKRAKQNRESSKTETAKSCLGNPVSKQQLLGNFFLRFVLTWNWWSGCRGKRRKQGEGGDSHAREWEVLINENAYKNRKQWSLIWVWGRQDDMWERLEAHEGRQFGSPINEKQVTPLINVSRNYLHWFWWRATCACFHPNLEL